mgnify:CR=1 FL=1
MKTKDSGKLILTATTAGSWMHPELNNWAHTPEELVQSAVSCGQAGAAIVHVHLPIGEEAETVSRIRRRSDVIIQAGMSSYPIEQRGPHFEARPDMLSIILNHHDERFPGIAVNQLHPLEELQSYCEQCLSFRIKPEWEVWHTGSLWNLRYLIEKSLVQPPHALTLFFNWPGGTWSPPTPEEYLHRLQYLPPDSLHFVSVMGKEQTSIASLAMANGGNVRVGTEDYPFLAEGAPAKDNAELVDRMVRIARQMGREVASPSEARQILGF